MTSRAVVGIGAACVLASWAGWHSPVRVVLALAFLTFGPGAVVGDLLDVRDPFLRLTVAWSASLALDTIVALSLVYLGWFTTGRAIAVVLLATIILVVAGLRLDPNGAIAASRRTSE